MHRSPRLRLLLVEDDEDHAAFIQDTLDLLQGRPVVWERVGSRAEAEARLRAEPENEGSSGADRIDAILLDLGLPDSTLTETLPHVLEAARGIPIVVLTTVYDLNLALDAVKQGAQDYLVKSQLSSEVLLRTLRYAVERARHALDLAASNRRLRLEVTERELAEAALRESEAELRTLNATLERHIGERTESLSRANAALEVRNRDLQSFAYVASHDLQEPLRKIRSFGDLLKAEYGDAIGVEGQGYLDRITGAAERLSALVRDLLSYSRVDTHGAPFGPVDMDQVAADVVQDLELVIQDTGATVEIEPMPTVTGDAVQLRRLFRNLVENALKYHRSDAPPKVRISAMGADEGSNVAVVVEDNGIGFDAKYSDRIFAPFQRLHTRDEYAGTGMGLAIVRRIAERHDGRVTAEGEPGQGSRFCVTLPTQTRLEQVADAVP